MYTLCEALKLTLDFHLALCFYNFPFLFLFPSFFFSVLSLYFSSYFRQYWRVCLPLTASSPSSPFAQMHRIKFRRLHRPERHTLFLRRLYSDFLLYLFVSFRSLLFALSLPVHVLFPLPACLYNGLRCTLCICGDQIQLFSPRRAWRVLFSFGLRFVRLFPLNVSVSL